MTAKNGVVCSAMVFRIPNAASKISGWAMSRNAARLTDWLLAASFVLSLIAYAYLGSYSKYMADDYSPLRAVRTHGLLGAQLAWYQAWSGRFSFTFVYSLLALMGPATLRLFRVCSWLYGLRLRFWRPTEYSCYRIEFASLAL